MISLLKKTTKSAFLESIVRSPPPADEDESDNSDGNDNNNGHHNNNNDDDPDVIVSRSTSEADFGIVLNGGVKMVIDHKDVGSVGVRVVTGGNVHRDVIGALEGRGNGGVESRSGSSRSGGVNVEVGVSKIDGLRAVSRDVGLLLDKVVVGVIDVEADDELSGILNRNPDIVVDGNIELGDRVGGIVGGAHGNAGVEGHGSTRRGALGGNHDELSIISGDVSGIRDGPFGEDGLGGHGNDVVRSAILDFPDAEQRDLIGIR